MRFKLTVRLTANRTYRLRSAGCVSAGAIFKRCAASVITYVVGIRRTVFMLAHRSRADITSMILFVYVNAGMVNICTALITKPVYYCIVATLVCNDAASVITEVIAIGAVGMGSHIGLTASVVTNMILRACIGMSECIAFGLAAYRTSLGSFTSCSIPIVSECVAFGLVAYRAGLGSVASCSVPIVSKCVSVGLTADGAGRGVGAVSGAAATLVIDRQAAFITFSVKGIGIIATIIGYLIASVIAKVIGIVTVGVSAHIGFAATVIAGVIEISIRVSGYAAVRRPTSGTDLFFRTSSSSSGMTKCTTLGIITSLSLALARFRTGRVAHIVSECSSVRLSADRAMCGSRAVSNSTATFMVNIRSALITLAVHCGIIASFVCDFAASVITKVIAIGAIGVSTHIGLTASVVTNMILRACIGMSECIAFGLAAYRTSFGSLAGCIVPIVSECFAFGLAANRAGLGSVAGRIVPIMSERFNENLAAFGTNLIGRTACRRTAFMPVYRNC